MRLTPTENPDSGQATVEAAFLIPVLFLALLMLLQPAFLLYDRIVMQSAAQEACRLLATRTGALGDMGSSCEAFVRHRLSAVPQHPCFHVHDGGCSWVVELEGDETSSQVSVKISTEVRPLPLLDAAGALLGLVNERGNLVMSVEATSPCQPAWVDAGGSHDPAAWIGGLA